MRTLRRVLSLTLLVLAVASAGCRGPSPVSQPPTGPAAGPPGPAARSAPVEAGAPGAPLLPDPRLTPGATLAVTTDDICVPGYTKLVRNVPASVKRRVYQQYGILTHAPGEYEVDHLISLELGGSNSIQNLWPQSYQTQPWNARVKDALENELHDRVCSGQLDLKTAQRDIAANWIEAYKKYYHTDRPLSSRTARRRPRPGAPQAPREVAPPLAAPISPDSTPDTERLAPPAGEVWVNTRSGKYFSPGSRYYGKTKEGQYMPEAEAQRYGYTPARGE